MRMTRIDSEKERSEFACRAANHFSKNPHHFTYTDKEIEADAFLAIRFGMDYDCVVVVKLDEFFEPINYQNIIHGQVDDKNIIATKIVKYLIDEKFPKEHLNALLNIACLFNESKESESDVFAFAEKLREKHSQG